MPGQMGLFLLLSPRRRVSHPALLVARVPRIHTTGARFFCGVPRGLRHGSSRDRPEGSTGSSLSLSLSSTGEILRLDFNTLASLISRSHSTFIPAASSPFNYNRRLLATPEGVKEVERVCNTLHSYLPDVTPTEVSRLTRAPTTYRHWYRRYQCHVYTCDIYIYIYTLLPDQFCYHVDSLDLRDSVTRALRFFHPRKFMRPFLYTYVDIILPNLRFYSKDRRDKFLLRERERTNNRSHDFSPR